MLKVTVSHLASRVFKSSTEYRIILVQSPRYHANFILARKSPVSHFLFKELLKYGNLINTEILLWPVGD